MVPATSSRVMITVLGGITMLSGLLVVLTYEITLPHIEENRRLAIERAVFKVIPGAVVRKDFLVQEKGIIPWDGAPGEGVPIYAGYDKTGHLLGIATEAAALGYQDVIRILYGYSPQCACITGISILKSTETPGLGDKIGKDPKFLANFNALDARLNADRTGLINTIVTVKHGTKTQPWQIEAISGATISSNAIGKMLNQSAQTLLPRLLPYIERLQENDNGD